MTNPWDSNDPTERRKYFGKYKGYVRDNADPENRSRIRCFCPQVMGSGDSADAWLGWAEACLPWLGGISIANAGSPFTKEQNGGVEVGVWVEFEGGDIDFPIYTGTFITTAQSPIDLTSAQGAVGGSIMGNPPPGSNVDALNPPKVSVTTELRLIVPRGIDLIIMSADGGSLNVGPAGVDVQGTYVRANGREIQAALDNVLG